MSLAVFSRPARVRRAPRAESRSETESRAQETGRSIFIHGANFAPEAIGVGKYTAELAFFLAERGHKVEAAVPPAHYPAWRVARDQRCLFYRREWLNAVDVWRCPLLTRGGSGLWRLIAPLSFAFFAAPLVFLRILLTRPDTVICVEPTLASFPAALAAAKIVGARKIVHVQDLEADAAFALHLRGAFARRLALAAESFLLRRFDLVATISNRMRDALIAKGVAPEKCEVFRNWVDSEAIRPRPRAAANSYRETLGFGPQHFVALYAGALARKQGLGVVVEAARLCQDQKHLRFVIVGDGPEKQKLMASAADLPNLVFLPLQPSDKFEELLAFADVHLLPQLKSSADLALPSKLGAMLASGRPILVAAERDSELGALLADAALFSPPEDPEALATMMKSAMKRDLSSLAARARALANWFSAKTVLPAFETAICGAETAPLATSSFAAAACRDESC